MKMHKKFTGFTLLELMITLVIASILLTVAIPSFKSISENRTLDTVQNTLLRDIKFAKSEALSLGRSVVVCQSSNGLNCTSDEDLWHRGWIVFVDNGEGTGIASNSILDGDEKRIRAYEPQKVDQLSVWLRRSEAGVNAKASSFIFNSSGRAGFSDSGVIRNSRFVFKVCDRRSNGSATESVRGVYIERSGQSAKTIDANGNGKTDEIFFDEEGVTDTRDLKCE